jgi:hypothetical protein
MELPSGKYRHFKGGLYEIVCIAKNSETLEDTVIYRSLTEPDKIWARPLSMWDETVERDGILYKRFTKID